MVDGAVGGAARGRRRRRRARSAHHLRLIAALALATCACPVVAEGEGPHPALGVRVPDFALANMSGGLLSLAEVTEPVVVLNLFAFWCDTWIEQLPQLRELATRQDDLSFRLISISVDGRWSDQLAQVCGDDPPPFPVLLDSGRTLSAPLGLRHVPTILILDRHRRARFVYEAYPGNHVALRAIRRTASTWLEAPSAGEAPGE